VNVYRRCLIVAAAIVMSAPVAVRAQGPAATIADAATDPGAAVPAPGSTVMLAASGSTVIQTDFPIKRFALTNPAIADATVVEPRQLLVDGKSAGNVSLIVWGESQLAHYELSVYPPIPTLQRQLHALYPAESVGVGVADEAIVLSGKVSSGAIAQKMVEIAEKSSSKSKVVNLLQFPGAGGGQQVMLQVKVAEVSQRAMTNLGASFFTGQNPNKDWIGRVTTQQFAAPDLDTSGRNGLLFSDFLNLFLFNTKANLGAVITALKSRGYFQSLAEPTLMAYNGQEASFLAGGEVPVPVVQGITQGVTVTYKEFGVRLTFTPQISGDVIRLKVKPEVSSLDYANGVTLTGFRIPALTTRRAETEVELRDGQSFAIGGMLNNISQTDKAGLPGLGDIPIIGSLFKSKAERKERTELVVIITPHLVQPLDTEPALPTMPQEFLPPPPKTGASTEPGSAQSVDGQTPVNAAGAPPAKAAPKFCVAMWCR
jgi:pilus assembly protein CpaC